MILRKCPKYHILKVIGILILIYQNELELWLADFTVNADTVKLDSGFSALDFTYVIPIDKVIEKTVSLYDEITSDPEAVALLSSLMTEEEEKIYLNRNLLTFYQEALNSLKLDQPVRMNKRVSAMGDLLRFRLELPLDERTAGYSSLAIETFDRTTVYTLKKEGQIIVLGIPGAEELKKQEFDQSVWYANIITEGDTKEHEGNCAVRINIKKTFEMHEEDEKSHETDHYTVSVVQDTSFLPDETDLTLLPEFTEISIEADLHYSSKFAQNSATNLDIEANLTKGDSSIRFEGSFKTAAPWLFMPFEVIDPVVIGTKKDEVLIPYITDWISNAASMIRHTAPEAEELPEVSENHAESAAEIPAGEADKDEAAGKDTDTGTEDTDAEAQPMDEVEIP